MSGQQEEKGTIVFGKKQLSPEQENEYREKIRAATGGVDALKGRTPVGVVERPPMPLLRQTPGSNVPLSHDVTQAGVKPRPPGSPAVRPETVEQIGSMQEAAAKMEAETKAKLDEEALKKEADDKRENLLDAFDFSAQGEAERILNNKKRRKEIEDRCQPMKLEDLIMRDEVRQTVPIKPGEFEVTFRSATPEESLFVKQLVAKENSPSDSYALEKYSLCMLCCSLVSINGKELPDHRKPDGSGPDEKMFEVKLKQLMKKSVYVITDLGLQFAWFDMRVRKLIAPEKLGNG